jgi:NAD-dependent SIR2 family protein deacetylase
MSDTLNQNTVEQAARAVQSASALLIAAGAGMGVDSGLPDFRGTEGFWRAYPPLQKLGLRFEEVADPRWFRDDPTLAWGFYGHRLNLYRATTPHAGFEILRRWGQSKPKGAFVFTSNVDGHFQRAGFGEESVCEVHGSVLFGQCSQKCTPDVWDAQDLAIEVDAESFRAREPLPRCPRCGLLARPNILMFGDSLWISERTDQQMDRLYGWLARVGFENLAVVEMGAGTAIPSVRRLSEKMLARGAALVRINPRESGGPSGTISLACGALDGLRAIDDALGG